MLHHSQTVFELVLSTSKLPRNSSKIQSPTRDSVAFDVLRILTRLQLKANGSSASYLIFSSCVFIIIA